MALIIFSNLADRQLMSCHRIYIEILDIKKRKPNDSNFITLTLDEAERKRYLIETEMMIRVPLPFRNLVENISRDNNILK